MSTIRYQGDGVLVPVSYKKMKPIETEDTFMKKAKQ